MDTNAVPGTLEMLDLSVPEYFVTNIGHVEAAGRSLIKFYCCMQDSGVLVPQFISTMPILRVAPCAKMAIHRTAEIYNAHMMMSGQMLC